MGKISSLNLKFELNKQTSSNCDLCVHFFIELLHSHKKKYIERTKLIFNMIVFNCWNISCIRNMFNWKKWPEWNFHCIPGSLPLAMLDNLFSWRAIKFFIWRNLVHDKDNHISKLWYICFGRTIFDLYQYAKQYSRWIWTGKSEYNLWDLDE